MGKRFLLSIITILLCVLMCGCFNVDRGLYDLGLETNLGTNLPEGGEVLYEIFAPMGKDAKEYAVIQYEEESQITEYFPWRSMDESAWKEVSRLIDCIELYISRNEKEESIPSDYLPSQDMLYTMVGNYPSLADPYVFFVFSPNDMRVYVLINLT